MGEGVEEGDDVRAPGMGGVRGHDLAEELDLVARGLGVPAGGLDDFQC